MIAVDGCTWAITSRIRKATSQPAPTPTAQRIARSCRTNEVSDVESDT
jgi:hypothetical protein